MCLGGPSSPPPLPTEPPAPDPPILDTGEAARRRRALEERRRGRASLRIEDGQAPARNTATTGISIPGA